MIRIHTLFLVVLFVASSAASSSSISDKEDVFENDTIRKFADEMESSFPGSIDWLYKWALEEIVYHHLEAIFDGRTELPINCSPNRCVSMIAFILSKNPKMNVENVVGHFARIFGTSRHADAIVKSVEQTKAILSVPDWFYQHLNTTVASGIPRDEIYQSLYQLVDQKKLENRVGTDDVRFNQGDGRIRGIAHIWLKYGFCFSDDECPVDFDSARFEWVMKPQTRIDALRYLALSLSL